MKYSIDKTEKYTVLTLQEEKLDTLKAPKLKSEFVTLYQAGISNLILDLTQVRYVDSSGLSAILVANRMSNEAEGKLILVGVNEHVMKLLSISKLDSVLSLVNDLEEAKETVFLNEISKDENTED